jgi:hypothetical protein
MGAEAAPDAPAGAGSVLSPNAAIDGLASENAWARTSGAAAASVRIASLCCGVHVPSA